MLPSPFFPLLAHLTWNWKEVRFCRGFVGPGSSYRDLLMRKGTGNPSISLPPLSVSSCVEAKWMSIKLAQKFSVVSREAALLAP